MDNFKAILVIIYMAAGYWATGQTIFYNKVIIHQFGALFWYRLIFGTLFGWILIPAAFVMRWVRSR